MMGEDLRWGNLRRNKCPKCNDDLGAEFTSAVFKCVNFQCGFVISEDKFATIISRMNKEAIERPDYRQGEMVEDLQKISACSFCHLKHLANEPCMGFGG